MQLTNGFYVAFLVVVGALRSDAAKKDEDLCGYCKFMVSTFKVGLLKTENQHFAGGNTDWEERNLGKFKTSETRLVEAMEHICKKGLDGEEFGDLKNKEFRCNKLAEDSEEILEKWYFKRQEADPDMFQYVCIDELKKCCKPGHYGPNCSPCPGALKGAPCFGNGKCEGDGSRVGTGKCNCNTGYSGVRCSACDAHYFAASQTDTSIECKACFDGCASGCKSEDPRDCFACRTGYIKDEEKGCIDVDECAAETTPCDKTNEKCVNTQGHYSCECEDGYKRNFDTDECEIDVQDPPTTTVPPAAEVDGDSAAHDADEL